MYVLKSLLILLKDFGILLEKPYRHTDDIVEIQSITPLQGLLILSVASRIGSFGKISHHGILIFLHAHEIVLCIGDLVKQRLFLVSLGVYIQLLADSLHHSLLIIRIINREMLIKTEEVYIPP